MNKIYFNKIYLSNTDVKRYVHDILRQIALDGFKPDYVVGITRGGLSPALMISHYLDIPCQTLKVSLSESKDCETNCWMAEDAFGYLSETEQETFKSRWDIDARKKILIVDDINDTGATINWIKQDWQRSCFPKEEYVWDSVWENTVKFATLVNNEASDYKKVSYTGLTINKLEDPSWIVFPWECWWK